MSGDKAKLSAAKVKDSETRKAVEGVVREILSEVRALEKRVKALENR